MDSKEPGFLAENQSVVSLVDQLQNYFKNSYSHYKIKRSQYISQLEAADEAQAEQLRQELHEIEGEITIFGSLSDALSIASRLLHSKTVVDELGIDSEIYKVHHDTDD
ncbi:MAG: hypothetical protein HC881_21460 [Leptolyngbyaceae cyanobacterium SL_7_1]|nr:hypothetical protein [Leptolyngbyaceae cyanobacterium SL_7_1]